MVRSLFPTLVSSFCALIFSLSSLFGQCNLVLSAGDDVYICPDELGQLNGSISGDYDFYEWSPGFGLSDPTILDPEVSEPGIYTLYAEYNTGSNIIINGDFSQGLSSFTSDYTHSTAANGACISPWGPLGCEGTFDILTNPQIGHTNFAQCSDQSGDGNMMVVNGSGTPNRRVWCQNVTVNPTSNYIFSAWVTSVEGSSPAILQFRINGDLLGNTFSPSGAVCNWSEHTANWSADGITSAQICLINQNTAAGGNDFALDNIQFTEVCVAEDEVEVFAVELEFQPEQPESITCSKASVQLSVNNVAGVGPNYRGQWTDPDDREIGPSYPPNYTLDVTEPGIYTFTYTFTRGNVECEISEIVEVIEEVVEIEAEAEVDGLLGCAGGTAFARATGSSFDGSYEFMWFTENGSIISDPNDSEITVYETGFYHLIVFDPESGCADTTSVEVLSDDNTPDAIIDFPEVLNCQNPFIELNGYDSNLPGDTWIKWYTEDGHFVDGTDDLGPIIDSAGTYRLILTNLDNGCVDSAEVIVQANFNQPQIELGPSDTLTCQIEFLEIISGPNQTNVEYNWTTPQGNVSNTHIIQASTEGLYILEAYDPLSECLSIDSIEIFSNQNYPVSNIPTPNIIDCSRDSVLISAIDIQPSSNIEIEWLDNLSALISLNDSSTYVANSGWYYVHITDLTSDCTFRDSVFVGIDTLAPSFSVGDSLLFTCSDTSVDLTGLQLGMGNYHPTWLDGNGNTISDNSWNVSVQSSGMYTLEVLDLDNGCLSSAVQVVSPDQNLPSISLSPIDTLNCEQNSIEIISTGSSSTGGTITYEWIDDFGNIISELPNVTIENPGNYSIRIYDESNDCSVSQSVFVQIDTVAPITGFESFDPLTCLDTFSNLTVSNYNPLLDYSWTTDGGTIDSIFNNGSSILSSTEGIYTLLLTNPENGCSSEFEIELTGNYDYPLVDFSEPPVLTCLEDTTVIAAIISNSGSSDILWTGPPSGIIGSNTNSIIRVHAAGEYIISIRNEENGCQTMDTILINENRDTIPVSFPPLEEISCNNLEVEVGIDLSTSNYEINWFDEDGTELPQNTSRFTTDLGGTYFFNITNPLNGCSSSGSIEVNENDARPEEIQYSTQDIICQQGLGSIEILEVLGGTAPYQLFIEGQASDINTRNSLAAGNHEIRIVDALGCEIVEEVFINQQGGFAFSLAPEYQIELGDSIRLEPVFSDPDLEIDSIHWSNIIGLSCSDCINPWAAPTEEQRYELEIFDANGCSNTSETVVKVIFDPIVFIPNSFSPNGDGNNDFFFINSKEKWITEVHYMQIYDRWGNELFYSNTIGINEPKEGWDGQYKGKQMNPGVYLYVVDMEFKNGKRQIYSGDVTLFR